MIDAAAEPLAARQTAEAAVLDERIKAVRRTRQRQEATRGAAQARTAPVPHRRTARRAGGDGRDLPRHRAVNGGTTDVDACAGAVRRIHDAIEALDRNPNEKLLLESLLWSLPDAQGVS